MIAYLVISVVLNAFLAVIFRYFTEFKVNNFVAIVINYLVCFAIGTVMTSGATLQLSSTPMAWWPFLLVLGTIFILTFNVIASTVQIFGITIAALVQKMSVLLVVIFAIVYYNEELNLIRSIGLLAGFVSIFLITGRPAKRRIGPKAGYLLALPIIVFFLGGVIDSTFVHISKLNLTHGQEDHFAALLFGIAGVLGMFVVLFNLLRGKTSIKMKDVYGGIALGVPNFFTVYCIQKMLTSDLDGSVVFPIHNIAILIFSAILSKAIFSEKFGVMKYVGIALAIIAILLLSFGN